MNHRHQEKKENQKSLLAKENLINNIKNETFCKLGVSKVSGIGVMAIKDIPKGTEVFRCCNEELLGSDKPIEIDGEDLNGVDTSILEHANNFIVPSPTLMPDGSLYYKHPFPFKGLNSINIIFYLNHSNSPNTEFSLNGDYDDFVTFVTSRGIKNGEELTQDYNNLSHDKARLYKQFPFLHNKK